MNKSVTIALDAMGGDSGTGVVAAAAKVVLENNPALTLILVGDEQRVRQALNDVGLTESAKVQIHHTTEVVEMTDPPSVAMRSKKDSSMRVAINLVKEGRADACVSAGNTGALMAIARFVLKTLKGIDRPAICTTIPAMQGHTHMLDLGANIDCTAEHLHQFAVMGATLAAAVDNKDNPRVGVLNIGAEDIKGNEQVKEAGRLIAQSDLNYIGFVEGNEIYNEEVDVVVCDGFVGNVSLKSSEGVARMIGYYLMEEFKRNAISKLVGLLALPIIKSFRSRIDWRQYNGASLLGLQGIVVKSHGSADAAAFANAINVAVLEVHKSVPEMIAEHIENHLTSEA